MCRGVHPACKDRRDSGVATTRKDAAVLWEAPAQRGLPQDTRVDPSQSWWKGAPRLVSCVLERARAQQEGDAARVPLGGGAVQRRLSVLLVQES